MVKKSPITKTKKTNTRVDYYPNRMTFAIAAAAAVSLTLLGVVAVYL